MPHNFRITGDLYVSKKGDDLNAGTDPNLPKRTIQAAVDAAALDDVIVVGSGDYSEGISATVNRVSIVSDGIVVVRSNGVDDIYIIAASTSISADNDGNFILSGFNSLTTCQFNNGVTLNGIVLENCEIGGGPAIQYKANRCVYNSCVNTSTPTHRVDADGCAFFNSVVGVGTTVDQFTNCYSDASSTLLTAAGITSNNFTNNNLQGDVIIGGTAYSLYFDSNGNPVSPTPSNPDIQAVYADIYTNRNSFNEQPSYFNLPKNDYYSVLASSVMLRTGLSLTNIGSVVYGSGFKASDADFYPGSSASNLILSAGDIVTTSTSGVCTTNALAHAPTSTQGRIVNRILVAARLNFDTDQAAGTSGNDNVVAVDDYGPGTAGENPKRLTVEMRWSISPTAPNPLNDAEWDNDNSNTGVAIGAWTKFEVGGLASVDLSGVGRGDPAFVETGSRRIRATYYQYRYTIREGLS